jgi:hypothetical protein
MAALAAVNVSPSPARGQETAKRVETLKAAGPNAGITVFPALLGNRVYPQMAEVLGLFLERGGMENLAVSDQVFQRPQAAPVEQVAAAFGEFVSQNPIPTEYALYAEFLASPGTGFTEVRGILVDRAGNTVWTDRQTAADEEFRRLNPKEPMECAVLLVARLREILRFQDPFRPDAPKGRLARLYAERTGLPTEAERAAMQKGLEVARTRFAGSKVAVFPILIGNQTDPTQAAHLAQLLERQDLGNVEVTSAQPVLEVSGGMNEGKRLWDLARAFRTHVRQAPPAAHYALYAEYGVDRARERAFFVHFVVCDRSGEWVIVDMLNDHHPVFQSVAPRSADDCDRLVEKRLADYLRR